ncbi:hypothetical protein KPG66_13330 [Mycetohabitans sp. B2]|uniref:hypothetical protein n=1 Tax=Mycetohabitans sp. B2 TaxID=2841274 RepID=UPI001F46AE46|nr:hypothetical protein [Mycetohabitans sp. B2]MCF7697024.1 hypothetical protein [Mycetohabitans sp. B2]
MKLAITAYQAKFEAQNANRRTSLTHDPSSSESASSASTSSLSNTDAFKAIRNKLNENLSVANAKGHSLAAAWAKGHFVREKIVKVQSHRPGIIQITIKGGSFGTILSDTPLKRIQEKLPSDKDGNIATYNMLIVKGGAESGKVIGTKEGEPPKPPSELAVAAPKGSAFINGGYFVHKTNLEIVQGNDKKLAKEDDIGKPVGPTATRPDYVDVALPWQNDYGQLLQDGKVGITSGPVLALNGQKTELDSNADRFQYRNANEENPLNKFAGALTHASDRNERAAVSVRPGVPGEPSDLVMHTLTTTKGKRDLGVEMVLWQDITATGADPAGKYKNLDKGIGVSTLNLDGGGSIYLGISDKDKVRELARSGQADIRPVANIISAQPAEKTPKE